MTITDIRKYADKWSYNKYGEYEWKEFPFPHTFPSNVSDLPIESRYTIIITIELEKGQSIISRTVVQGKSIYLHQKGSTQEEYEHFLKLNKFLLDKFNNL